MRKSEYPAPAAEPQLKKLWQLAFGDSEDFIDRFFSAGYAPDRCRYLPAGEEAAAALYWLDCECDGQKFAYIYAVATHPDHRGRGLCRLLMEDTHRILAERGYAGAVLMPAGEGLRRMYGKMGYRDFGGLSEFACAAGEKIPVRQIGQAEYAALRRKMLPEGGVIQEGASLAYLETYAKLYAGADFLLAAVPEGQTLFGIELLGNRDAAPGILSALGFENGTFRSPGTDIPFGMFLPLKIGAKNPTYLGHAFD